MIFLTVGTQLPFDRLVRAMDSWCESNPDQPVTGQIGQPDRRGYRPRHFEWSPFLPPAIVEKRFEEAEVVVAHAGMGSIITALLNGKPIVIMPRRAHLGEHRNDHQYATAESFRMRPLVYAAMGEAELSEQIESALHASSLGDGGTVGRFAEAKLLQAVRATILSVDRHRS